MSTRFKWIFEDTIQKGDKYAKIYHGEYRSGKNDGVCDYVKHPKTFINYGLVVKYCPHNNEVFFAVVRPTRNRVKALQKYNKFVSDRIKRHINDSVGHKTIRLTRVEEKIIKKNKNIIDVKMLDVILNRDVR